MATIREVLLPTDIHDPATGEPLYVWVPVLPRWRWYARRLALFLGIVWRPAWQEPYGFLWLRGRIGLLAAWEVARDLYDSDAKKLTPRRVRELGFPPERVR